MSYWTVTEYGNRIFLDKDGWPFLSRQVTASERAEMLMEIGQVAETLNTVNGESESFAAYEADKEQASLEAISGRGL